MNKNCFFCKKPAETKCDECAKSICWECEVGDATAGEVLCPECVGQPPQDQAAE